MPVNFEELFGLVGYAKGFAAARDKIAVMLEEEGKGQTAQRVRKMELKRKG